jgi:uncharacterized membrane protein
MKEKRFRSITKAVSWRVTGSIDTFIISFIVTGKPGKAFAISGIEVFTKIFLYYFHERIWNRLSFGRKLTSEEISVTTAVDVQNKPYYLPSILMFLFGRFKDKNK